MKALRLAATLLSFLGMSGYALAAAEPIPCKTSPHLVGPCFVMHARLSLYNGTLNLRLWQVGTHRMYAVLDGNGGMNGSEVTDYPKEPDTWLAQRRLSGFDASFFGDYEVCPLTVRKPGVMQFVCIESLSHMVARQEQ
jgi:hypothetical protein